MLTFDRDFNDKVIYTFYCSCNFATALAQWNDIELLKKINIDGAEDNWTNKWQ